MDSQRVGPSSTASGSSKFSSISPTREDTEYWRCLDRGDGDPVHRVRSTARAVRPYSSHSVQDASFREAFRQNAEVNAQAGIDHTHHIPRRDTEPSEDNVTWRLRVRHFTWAFFTLTMATGGIANVLDSIPFRFRGLQVIGDIVFLLNIAFFLIILALLITRFVLYPYTFKASFLHPTESLFVPAAMVSFGTILINIAQYGPLITEPWLATATEALFWIDLILASVFSGGIYLVLWSTQTFTIAQMTPIWIFPAYPMLIVGPYAGVISGKLSPYRSLRIIIGGATIQGVGFLMSLMVYSAFLYRLMSQKLPKEDLRPGMFVSVGPSGFTVSGIVNMAINAKRAFPSDFMGNGSLAADVIKVTVNFAALWMWGLAVFFFISVFAHWSVIGSNSLVFSMGWYAFVFPNTALLTATFAIAKALDSQPIRIVATALVIPLVLMYIFVFTMMVRAIINRDILWPQKNEEKEESVELSRMKPDLPREADVNNV